LQRPTERAYKWHPQLWEGKFSWVAALTPDGAVRYWLNKAAGLQTIDATTSQRRAEVISQEFKVSEGVGLRDNIRWQLLKRRYLVDIPEVHYGKVGDQVHAVAPIVSYRGFLVKYPVFSGAFIVSPEGQVEELNPEAAMRHPAVLATGRLYPEAYTRFMHESYALKHGVINKWFRHVDQTEISDPPGEDNHQPYMLATKEGLMWVSAADPWGNSFGIYKIFMTNALTGNTRIYTVEKDSSLTGASQAVGYVKSSRPQYNWETTDSDGEGGNIRAIEPRPVFVNQQLLWMISVTTDEGKGINETCFVSAHTNNVSCHANEEKINEFLARGEAAEEKSSGQDKYIEEAKRIMRKALEELERLQPSN
jgi:hypothetical protein